MFAFTLAIKLLTHQGGVDPAAWRFLLAGPATSSLDVSNPAPEWLTEKAWTEISFLPTIPGFGGFSAHFVDNIRHYKAIFDAGDAHVRELGGEWEGKLTPF